MPIILCHLRELTHEAAARELSCPVGTVHGRLSRARELLRRRLTRRGVAFPAGTITAALVSGGTQAACTTVPASLHAATARAATNLAAGQAIATSGTSAAVATLVADSLRSMTLHVVKVAAVIGLSLITAAGVLVLAGKGFARSQEGDGPKEAHALDDADRMRDMVNILGTWTVVEIGQVNHQPTEEEKAYWKSGQFTVSLTTDRITFNADGSSALYQLDFRRTPGRMMLTRQDAAGNRTVQLALYSLDGDDLKICMGRGERGSPPEAPESFDIKAAPRGTSPTLFVMKRKVGPLAADEAPPPRKDQPLEIKVDPKDWIFDDGYSMDLPGGKDDVLFVDLDTGRHMTPPFDLESAEPSRPLVLTNLAFPQKLRDWIRFQGLDVAVQSDGETITLVGLETKEGRSLPASSKWSSTKLEILTSINTNPRQADPWLRFRDTFQQENRGEAGNHGLPFVTREAGLGILSLRLVNPRGAGGKDEMRLDCRIDRGMNLEWQGSPGQSIPVPARKIPEPSILRESSGTVLACVRDETLVVRRPGAPDQIEVGKGKVIVRAGPNPSDEILLEAGRLGTPAMRFDGRRGQVEFLAKVAAILRRDGEDLVMLTGKGRSQVRSPGIALSLPDGNATALKQGEFDRTANPRGRR